MLKSKSPIGGLAAIPLGMVFVIAGLGKLLLGQTAFALPAFIPQYLTNVLFTSLPYIEIIIGSLLILGVAIKFVSSLAGILIIGFVVSNLNMINLGVTGCPGCFGAGSLTPATAILLDCLMALMVTIIILFYNGKLFNKIPLLIELVKQGREGKHV